jgi:hypothetical protein
MVTPASIGYHLFLARPFSRATSERGQATEKVRQLKKRQTTEKWAIQAK